MIRKPRKELNDEIVTAVAVRKAAGLSNRTIMDQLSLSRHYLDKTLADPRFKLRFYESLETIAEMIGGK